MVEEKRTQAKIEEEDKSFAAHVAREGARIVDDIRNEHITASSAEAAKGQEELAAKDALAIDILDELQIAEELRGRVIAQYFYEFESSGRTVTGIAYAGIKAIAREMGKRGEAIDIPEVTFDSGEDMKGPWIGCLAKAKNMRTNETRWGYASQALVMKLRSGGEMSDPFAKVKVLSKAQRNAIRAFIPELVIVEMYREWKGTPKGKRATEVTH